jgi:hypothetical protein
VKPVLHVITTICRGGAENQLLTLIREQVSTGRKVNLIFLKGQPELMGELRQMGVEVHPEFSLLSPFAQVLSIRGFLKGKDVLVHGHLPRAELIARCNATQCGEVLSFSTQIPIVCPIALCY